MASMRNTLMHSFKYMLSLQTVCCALFYCDVELLGYEGLSYWLSVGLSGFCHTGGLWGCQDFITLVDYGAVRVLSYWWTMGLSVFCHAGGLWGSQGFVILVDCWAVRVLSCWWTMGLSGFFHTGDLWGCHGFVILVDYGALVWVTTCQLYDNWTVSRKPILFDVFVPYTTASIEMIIPVYYVVHTCIINLLFVVIQRWVGG